MASISVLVPAKNGGRYLGELLTALKNQRGDASVEETITAGSGSRDRNVEILRCHGARVIQVPPQERPKQSSSFPTLGPARGELASSSESRVMDRIMEWTDLLPDGVCRFLSSQERIQATIEERCGSYESCTVFLCETPPELSWISCSSPNSAC